MKTKRKQFIDSFIQRVKNAFSDVFDNPVGRPAKKALITVVGVFVTLLGVVLFVLPGPGFLFVVIGLGILAIEYPKARTYLRKFQGILSASAKKADDFFARRKA